MAELILRAQDLTKDYGRAGRSRVVHAVQGVSLSLTAGDTVGIVGESGCGKSTLGRLLVGLEAPSSGSLEIGGRPVAYERRRRGASHARQIQLVSQNPFASKYFRMAIDTRWRSPMLYWRRGRRRSR